MTNSSPPPYAGLSLDGIEVVELSEVDLDFAVEEAFRETAPRLIETTTAERAASDDLRKVGLFADLGEQELAKIAVECQSIRAIPGYVLLAPGRLNSRVYFVIEGQLRLYAQTGDKRPMAIVDVGHSTGLRPALVNQPANHAVIVTEVSHILAVELGMLEACAKHSHVFARNYAALLASYLRGDNCLHVGARMAGGSARPGYVDELTLLHNQYWLDTMLPRLVGRYRFHDTPLAVAAFAVDKLDETIKHHGLNAGLRVLQALGHWVLDKTRPTDLLAIDKNRYIYAFLPDCDLNAARALAGRLREAIQSLSIPLRPDKAIPPVKVTLSFGIAQLAKGMKEKELLQQLESLIRKSLRDGGDRLSDAL